LNIGFLVSSSEITERKGQKTGKEGAP